MDNILLQYILDLLTSWSNSFNTWANNIGDKIAAIKTNTDSLLDIKSNTDDIKDNTAAVITPISNINTNVSAIATDVSNIEVDTIVIKNNATSIATSSGTTAAFTEDIADNTLDCSNRLVTIGSDTTQIRTDSDSIAADVTEIKNTLGLYLYNTIVTEDAEGAIANFDTDLKDYLQKAIVTIPADAGGVSGITINSRSSNLWDNIYELGSISTSTGAKTSSTTTIRSKNNINLKGGVRYSLVKPSGYQIFIAFYDKNDTCLQYVPDTGDTAAYNITASFSSSATFRTFTTPADTSYCLIRFDTTSYNNDVSLNYPSDDTELNTYSGNTQTITFNTPITDGAEVDLLSGIVKINTSPVTYDSITPIAIRTYKGVNNIYSDIGDIDITYRETLKHYLEKQNNSRSINRNVNLLRENIESIEDSDRREI